MKAQDIKSITEQLGLSFKEVGVDSYDIWSITLYKDNRGRWIVSRFDHDGYEQQLTMNIEDRFLFALEEALTYALEDKAKSILLDWAYKNAFVSNTEYLTNS